MTKIEITGILDEIKKTMERNIVIIDFSNLIHWQNTLGWEIGIKELKILISQFTVGRKFLRRFYYGSDYGEKEYYLNLTPGSETVLNKAKMNNFEICTKRVKYIKNSYYKEGYVKKCDLDVEMAVDLVKEKDNYDKMIIFSGDGDLAYVIKYLKEFYNKTVYIFAARNHLGKELVDCEKTKIIRKILFVEDFKDFLNRRRA